MKILAIVGSLREMSFNKALALRAQKMLAKRHPEVEFTILDWSGVPLLNQDIEFPAPDEVFRVREEIKAADGIWIFSPEYNHGIPGVLKNLLDWMSRPQGEGKGQVMRGKPIALSGTTPGMGAALQAQDSLVTLLSLLRTEIMNAPRLAIPHIEQQMENGALLLNESESYLEKQADAFIAFIESRKAL